MHRTLFLLLLLALAAPVLAQPFEQEETFDLGPAVKAQFVELDGLPTLDLAIATEGNVFSPTDNGFLSFFLYQTGETGALTYSDPIPALVGTYTALSSFAFADVNGDFLPDGVVVGALAGQAGFPTGSVTTYINQGFPVVPLAATQTLADGLFDVRVVDIADLDGDTNLDVVAFFSDGTNTGQAVYYPGDGMGAFGTAVSLAPANTIRDVRGAAIADVNGDTALDVAVASTSGQVLVFLNDGSGGFSTVTVDASLGSAQDVAFGNVTGDANVDVVAVGQTDGIVAAYAGDGTGGFGSRVTISSSEVGVNNLAVGDIDQDGDDDIATAASFAGARFAFFENLSSSTTANARATFGPGTLIATGVTPRDVLLGDADQDASGDLDLITVDRATLGSGTTGFFRKTAAPLPVELVGFEAQLDGADAVLTWATASETNNAGFAIEHRTPEAEAFDEVNFVTGMGSTTERQTYAHRVDALVAGTHTFRLRQVDFDGAFAYSPEVEVTVALDAVLALAVYPNPVASQAAVRVSAASDVRVVVYDVLGREVAVLLDGPPTAAPLRLDAQELPTGLYVVRATTAQGTLTRSLTVTR
ncbi:MAG: T9SS type A sorting domain-containing protein [Bacteroidota bacterium]